MNKIPTVFVRDPKNMSRVLPDVTRGCEWVFGGEGTPTQKRDGTNIRITVVDGTVTTVEKRRNPSREEKAKGAEPGYVAASRSDPSDQHIFAAVDATAESLKSSDWRNGTWSCEALGPKIQGGVETPFPSLYFFTVNPVRLDWPEGQPVTVGTIRAFLEPLDIEGIVWHHPDGRMAKIKRRDFGFRWPNR